jgi:tRNA nucleotidyltransferase (CCA-adding enzyme)
MPTPTIEVILSHEHTDFDALASLLAASLLFPAALPVLPYNLNRNVRDFLALYKNQFPFVLPKELPRGHITRAILVDTRTVNLPKGTQDETTFLVIDHHTLDQKLPERWELWSEAVGANTTLFVEKLMEQNRSLSSVQATLLALGIHEDTGSLTYGATTHRDARSLAWLMEPERGVNLDVLNQFLRHPLSNEQRKLLEALIDHSEFLEIAGHTVVIAQAEAPSFNSEISTLAHRLRDIHESDAVFLVIRLKDIIQVVARSTTDAVDVGKVTRALGGGGHVRAAAAPVHEPDTQTVHDRIVALLQENSHMAITVRHIMSMGRPQTVAPDLTIHAAGVLMRRYGHEGFPVVKKQPDGNETLLGVLTRRETDRAINHNMGDAQVHRFMQVGQVTVRPTDSIATLRKTMIESNWGQIPVVDEQNRIIGIVTRTDLIKLWDEVEPPNQHKDQIDQRLKTTLAPAQYALLRLIGQAVDELNFTVYVVGGFVRDLLLDAANASVRTPDMDIVIEGNAIDFAEKMQREYGGRVVAHKRFGTAKWLLDDSDQPVRYAKLLADLTSPSSPSGEEVGGEVDLPAHLDFVTARTEFYTAPTVLPTTEQSSIKLDLHRRDFTINTLAICLNPERWGELLDFYGGMNDLKEGSVRVLHSLSFVDDPTRILRAVRYEQRFNFRIDPRTLELLQDALELLDRVTPARIRHEFERILQEAKPEKALQRLDELGVLKRLHPDLKMDARIANQFARLRAARYAPDADPLLAQEPIEHLYWGLLVQRLSAEAHTALSERLGLRGEIQRMLNGLRLLQENRALLCDPQLLPSRAVEVLDKVSPVDIALFRVTDGDPQIAEVLQRYITEWRAIRAELNGNDLQTSGLPRGPLYSKILTQLRAARLDGVITTREEELALAQQIAIEAKASGESAGS